MGMEAAKLTDASASAEPASVVTTQPWANCCIQVPVCEIVCPLQKSANSRLRSTWSTLRCRLLPASFAGTVAPRVKGSGSLVPPWGRSSDRSLVSVELMPLLICLSNPAWRLRRCPSRSVLKSVQKCVLGSNGSAGANSFAIARSCNSQGDAPALRAATSFSGSI